MGFDSSNRSDRKSRAAVGSPEEMRRREGQKSKLGAVVGVNWEVGLRGRIGIVSVVAVVVEEEGVGLGGGGDGNSCFFFFHCCYSMKFPFLETRERETERGFGLFCCCFWYVEETEREGM